MKNREGRKKVIIIALSVVVSFVVATMASIDTYKVRGVHTKNVQTIAQLEKELSKLKNISTVSEKTARANSNNASIEGNRLAAAQNNYRTLKTDDEKLTNNVKVVDSLLIDSSKSARVPWFNYGDNWKFISTYSYPGDKFPAVFYNYDKDNNILAVSIGNFYSEQKQFGNFKIYITDPGAKLQSQNYN